MTNSPDRIPHPSVKFVNGRWHIVCYQCGAAKILREGTVLCENDPYNNTTPLTNLADSIDCRKVIIL
jgi:hypothetical protein